jgi:hypothetical protein
MVQLCKKCSRANPTEAIYCYFDGFVLGGHEAQAAGGPVAVGAQLFQSPFVFPTGRTCRNFDELAIACQENWSTACGLLRDGYLEKFFSGLGRVDLAIAAAEAARFPDLERGLDQLLAILPSNVLSDPRLRVDPIEVNLGQLDSDQERTFPLELENQGMRLLYGTVSAGDAWLLLGDAPGSTEKHFHLTHEQVIPVRVNPKRLRASTRPIETKLFVESNAGSVTVLVRAEKKVHPFPEGPLGGLLTPRQVAEVAQKTPKAVAPLFETGEVERWYAANGWVYPVKIPAASGIAGIQQFFEALGVTKAPAVEISVQEFSLSAEPGGTLSVELEVFTQEKRPVFAHATSNVSWLEVGKPKHNGKTVLISATIPLVPNEPGNTLSGILDVVSNGNKHWRVPVRLEVRGNAFDFSREVPPPAPAPAPPPVPVAVEKPVQHSRRVKTAPPPERKARRHGAPLWLHVVPALLLVGAVLGVVAYDLWGPRMEGGRPRVKIAGPAYDPDQLIDQKPRIGVQFNEDYRFGVVMLDQSDPDDRARWKRLTFRDDGSTNNTVVKIAGSEYLFGYLTPSNTMTVTQRALPRPYLGWISEMDFRDERIRVMQYVQYVPGKENVLDTVLIYYRVTNNGTIPQRVALRILLDTYIGKNDGVPFTAPGEKGFVTKKADYSGSGIPDYLEVIENPEDSNDPGTIARIGLRGLSWGDVELLEPVRVRICKFPGQQTRWEWEAQDMENDSCVAVYWPEEELAPKKTMNVALTYGLGKLDISNQLALSAPASVNPGREFVVTAYVYNAEKGQKVTLTLPPGVELVSDTAEKIIAESAKRTQVFWKLRATDEGAKPIEAISGRARAQPVIVRVQKRSIFG